MALLFSDEIHPYKAIGSHIPLRAIWSGFFVKDGAQDAKKLTLHSLLKYTYIDWNVLFRKVLSEVKVQFTINWKDNTHGT